jgi:rubrerythrin
MEHSNTLEILKHAIILERRGKVFYANAVENSIDPDVKSIFQIMEDEEDDHVKFLIKQFHHFKLKGKFGDTFLNESRNYSVADQVITKSIVEKISAVSFEATAISLAIDLENRAITVYSERALNASDPEEKSFYLWLADWERSHHRILFELDRELKEKVWADNSFWAF